NTPRTLLQKRSNRLIYPSGFLLLGEFVLDDHGAYESSDLVSAPSHRLNKRAIRIANEPFLGLDGLLKPLGEVAFHELAPRHGETLSLRDHTASVLPLLRLPVDRLVRLEPCPPDTERADDP